MTKILNSKETCLPFLFRQGAVSCASIVDRIC
jgi:hypothetical protein